MIHLHASIYEKLCLFINTVSKKIKKFINIPDFLLLYHMAYGLIRENINKVSTTHG